MEVLWLPKTYSLPSSNQGLRYFGFQRLTHSLHRTRGFTFWGFKTLACSYLDMPCAKSIPKTFAEKPTSLRGGLRSPLVVAIVQLHTRQGRMSTSLIK